MGTPAYYKPCPDCGANLDPGERCTCKDTKCKCCGETLKWGKFAYEQNMCWSCFKKKMHNAAVEARSDEASEMICFAMKVVAESFGEKWW